MGTQHYTEDQRIIGRYMDQLIQLPTELRARIEAMWGGQRVQLYAFLDSDSRYRMGDRWLAMGQDYIAVAEQDEAVGDWLIDIFGRSRVRGLFEAPMLSGNVLWILAGSGEAALAVIDGYRCTTGIVTSTSPHVRNRIALRPAPRVWISKDCVDMRVRSAGT
jgi:hypothetical protein